MAGSVECIGIRFRRVLFGMGGGGGGQPGQMMFCPMTGMAVSIYLYIYIYFFFIHMLVIRNCVTVFFRSHGPLSSSATFVKGAKNYACFSKLCQKLRWHDQLRWG